MEIIHVQSEDGTKESTANQIGTYLQKADRVFVHTILDL
jgi:hypothetical protein